jgi:glycosyltransferase involved in cell wall biosynthesis
MTQKRVPLTVLTITRNEEINLERCLRSVRDLADQLIVIDSESKDRTVEIAKRFADTVHELPYDPMKIGPQLYQWALDNSPIRNDWILLLEADQTISPELADEMRELFAGPMEHQAYYIRRIQVFRGRELRHGGYGNKYLLRFFERKHGWLDEREWDTRPYVEGTIGKLRNCMFEDNLKENDIVFFAQKLVRYIEGAATEEVTRRREGFQWDLTPKFFGGTHDQRTLAKKLMFYRAPLYMRSVLYFMYRYVALGGFLDGKEGAIFHFFQSLWYPIAWDIRVEELMRRADEANTRRGPPPNAA